MKASTHEATRESLNRAFASLDNDDMSAAATWASIAAETIEAASLTPEEQRGLVAPRDDVPLGEKVLFVAVILILLAVIGDALRGFMQ